MEPQPNTHSSIFWIEIEKIRPNPYQPRREFDEQKLADLAESVRQYGVLQPLVVTRHEVPKQDGGIAVEYELIAGERRFRASRLAGLAQIPAIIRNVEDNDRVKLELAIIENLQREDLNPIDRARAFQRLVDEFNFKHSHIAKKISKSREYVSNSLRLLALPEEILSALASKKISEGHARPLMMLTGRTEEQLTLFKEILAKNLTVRDAEGIARRIAHDRIRKKDRAFSPEVIALEESLTERIGSRVQIEQRDAGGKITIDFSSPEDLNHIVAILNQQEEERKAEAANANRVSNESQEETEVSSPIVDHTHIEETVSTPDALETPEEVKAESPAEPREETPESILASAGLMQEAPVQEAPAVDTQNNTEQQEGAETPSEEVSRSENENDSPAPAEQPTQQPTSQEEQKKEEDDLYFIKNFSL